MPDSGKDEKWEIFRSPDFGRSKKNHRNFENQHFKSEIPTYCTRKSIVRSSISDEWCRCVIVSVYVAALEKIEVSSFFAEGSVWRWISWIHLLTFWIDVNENLQLPALL